MLVPKSLMIPVVACPGCLQEQEQIPSHDPSRILEFGRLWEAVRTALPAPSLNPGNQASPPIGLHAPLRTLERTALPMLLFESIPVFG
jgi:hypothetical protein